MKDSLNGTVGMSSLRSQIPLPQPFLRVILLLLDLTCYENGGEGGMSSLRSQFPAPTRHLNISGLRAPSEIHFDTRKIWRRGRDSNPGWGSLPITIFETVPFNRSGTPPRMG